MLIYSETFFKSGAYAFLHALERQNLREGGCGSICYKVPFFRLEVQWQSDYSNGEIHSDKHARVVSRKAGAFSGRVVK